MVLVGRSGRIRTCDPLIPNQVRYQAALRSVALSDVAFTREFALLRQALFSNFHKKIDGLTHNRSDIPKRPSDTATSTRD